MAGFGAQQTHTLFLTPADINKSSCSSLELPAGKKTFINVLDDGAQCLPATQNRWSSSYTRGSCCHPEGPGEMCWQELSAVQHLFSPLLSIWLLGSSRSNSASLHPFHDTLYVLDTKLWLPCAHRDMKEMAGGPGAPEPSSRVKGLAITRINSMHSIISLV